ncbi:MAG: Exopolysaccharide transport protein [Gammaproteobacteria bacterium]|jgi:tyrosine-protein kinase Etk/Wzc|nr:Exopolysaccharide transport protein [Gammaproteobacteria bacterium]
MEYGKQNTISNNSGQSQQSFAAEQIDLHQLYHIIKANRWFIAAVAAACILLTIIFLFLKSPVYSSNILLQVEDKNSLAAGLDSSAASMLLPAQAGAAPQDVQTVLIKSRFILEPVVRKLSLDLDIKPDYFPIIGAWYARHHEESLTAPAHWLSHYAWGGEKLSIDEFTVPAQDKNSHFILVALPSQMYALYQGDQLILQGKVGQTVQANVDGLGKFTFKVRKLLAHPNTHFSILKKPTQQFIDGLARQLKITDLGLNNQLQGKTGVLQVSLDGINPEYIVSVLNTMADVVVQKDVEKKAAESTKTLGFLRQQLPIVKKSLDDAELALNQYVAKSGTINLSEAEKILLAQISDTQKQLEMLHITRAAALEKYTPAHPFIIALDEKIKASQQELKLLETRASQLPMKDQAAVSLMRDVRVKSQLYLVLLNRIQSVQVSKAGTVSSVRILAPAVFPEGPVPLSYPLILLGSLIFGLILGSMIVLIRQTLHRKVSDPTKIEELFGLQNMAIVPYSQKQKEIIATYDPKSALLPLLVKDNPQDLAIEALRSFRTSLKFAMLNAQNNIIAVSGISPGVGKSFISANFAYLLADTGKKVLLIDGDIRKGHLKNYFKGGQCPGLTEVIAGSISFEEAVITGPVETLHFLASGAYPPNPSELLMNAKFKDLLQKVSAMYDLVIIDTAPILAVTDAAIIMHYTGTNFLVLSSDAHEVAEIQLALKRFATNGVKIDGTVFNFRAPESGLYRRHAYTYNYQYKYE